MKTKVLSYVAVFVLLAVMAGCSNGDAVLNTEKETAANKENADLTAFASADAPTHVRRWTIIPELSFGKTVTISM